MKAPVDRLGFRQDVSRETSDTIRAEEYFDDRKRFHVKHLNASHKDLLAGLLATAGLAVPATVQAIVMSHLEWLLATNEELNLTAVTDPAEAVRLHAVDSLMALPELGSAPEGLLVDIGTGGGFPGLELAVASERTALLVDSVRKKARALNGFLVHQNLAPRISVSEERSETLALQDPGCAAVVTARAVADLPVLVELASPLLVIGGRLVALKARLMEDEVARGAAAADVCGMIPAGSRQFSLPGGDEVRTILVYEKISASKIVLPRRPGVATKKPLA